MQHIEVAAGIIWGWLLALPGVINQFLRAIGLGVITRAWLGLPLLALAKADPARLGAHAGDWGRYYEAQPVVVAGPIRLALERIGGQA